MNQREIIAQNVERWTKTWRGQYLTGKISQAAADLRDIHLVLAGRPPRRPSLILEDVFGIVSRGRWDDWSHCQPREQFETWRRKHLAIWRTLCDLGSVNRLLTRGPDNGVEYSDGEISTLCEYLDCTRDQLLDPNYQPPRGRR